jgi:hypothetical protein
MAHSRLNKETEMYHPANDSAVSLQVRDSFQDARLESGKQSTTQIQATAVENGQPYASSYLNIRNQMALTMQRSVTVVFWHKVSPHPSSLTPLILHRALRKIASYRASQDPPHRPDVSLLSVVGTLKPVV